MAHKPYIIWTGGKPRQSVPEGTTYLRLVYGHDEGVAGEPGSVVLVVCDALGSIIEDRGRLLELLPNKTIQAQGSTTISAGMALNAQLEPIVRSGRGNILNGPIHFSPTPPT